MASVAQTIQLLVAPVVMISACGLLCLALYNRLAAVVSRLRGFHRERMDDLVRVRALPLEEQAGPTAHLLRQRLDTLDLQVRHVTERARLLRGALLGLLAGVLCMLGCSLAIGVSLLLPATQWVALALFVVGVASMGAGVVLAIGELRRSLEPVELEQASFERVQEQL